MKYQSFIVQDPAICNGEPVVKGTRIPLRTVLDSLADGASVAEILEDFPALDETSVRAVIAASKEWNRRRVFGQDRGLFDVPDDFDDPLPEDAQASFER